jgi:hypothetical protein
LSSTWTTEHRRARATLTNNGSYGLPACTATGFDSHGKAVFAGRLFFALRIHAASDLAARPL